MRAKTVAIAEVLAAQQERRGAPPAARAAAERLGDPATVAVVTGQQAGAFGGPLFTLLKAVTAIQLARRVSADQGVSAVAVFWVDAEDHDWEEVRSCTVLDAELSARIGHARGPERRRRIAGCRVDARRTHRTESRGTVRRPARHRFFRDGAGIAPDCLPARDRDGGGVREMDRDAARAVRPGRVRICGPRRKRAGGAGVPA